VPSATAATRTREPLHRATGPRRPDGSLVVDDGPASPPPRSLVADRPEPLRSCTGKDFRCRLCGAPSGPFRHTTSEVFSGRWLRGSGRPHGSRNRRIGARAHAWIAERSDVRGLRSGVREASTIVGYNTGSPSRSRGAGGPGRARPRKIPRCRGTVRGVRWSRRLERGDPRLPEDPLSRARRDHRHRGRDERSLMPRRRTGVARGGFLWPIRSTTRSRSRLPRSRHDIPGVPTA
jgi:hypothetical protein